MTYISLFAADDPTLNYVVTHVFFPVEIPKESDYTIQNDLSLARAVCTAAHAYITHIDDSIKPQWHAITKALDNLQTSVHFERLDKANTVSQLGNMRPGGKLSSSVQKHF